MQSRKLWQAIFFILLIGFSGTATMAQSNKNIVTLNGGQTVLYTGPRQPVAPGQVPAKAVTIYSNLGTKNSRYNGSAGVGILGRDAGQPWPEAVANGFTPLVDHIVQAIQVGLGYVSGSNEVVVALMDDNHGNPGHILHAWHVSNLPPFGSCCTLETVYDKAGIPVTGGVQYWVVVAPADPNGNTYAVWDNNISNLNGAFDNDIGSGWQGQSYQTLAAFAVYGQ